MPGTTALALLVLAQLSAPAPSAAQVTTQDASPAVETLKERLSDKASDEQRVDNCRVAPERRGATPRPDCAVPTQPAQSRAAGARVDR